MPAEREGGQGTETTNHYAEGIAEANIKPDVKSPRRVATTYLGQPGLLRMLGAGDEDHILTKVMPGTDPLQEYDEDDPSQLIVLDYETNESSDADNLSMVSMTSAGGIGRDEFQGVAVRYQLHNTRRWQPL